ncbi:MAG: transcription antitermination factor NusB [Thermoleophilia bacterium]|nr:transcription antitermination factor NusB [Thermoleophilia bacterium]
MAKSDTRKTATPEAGRTRARRNAMMVLYKVDLLPSGQVQDSLDAFESEHGFPLPRYARELVVGVSGNIERIDAELDSRLTGWSLGRLGAVERSIMRIAMYELLTADVPYQVVIDEAIELAKRYASPEAAKLVNGVLGTYVRQLNAGELDEKTAGDTE